MKTKEQLVQEVNELEIKRIKLIGKIELLDEQEKEAKPVDNPEASA
jgi:hypothetical protein